MRVIVAWAEWSEWSEWSECSEWSEWYIFTHLSSQPFLPSQPFYTFIHKRHINIAPQPFLAGALHPKESDTLG